MGEVIKSILAGLLRYALAGVFAWMIDKGIATPDQVGILLTGLSGFLALIVWMAWNKIKARVEVLTALTAQPGTSMNELKDQIRTGASVPAATSNDASPRVVKSDGYVRPRIDVWLLPLLLTGAMLGTGCASMGGTVTPNPTVDQAQAVRDTAAPIVDAMTTGAQVVVEAGRTADQMQQAGLITVTERKALDRAIIAFEGKAISTLRRAKTVTTYPQLTTTLTELRDAIDPILQATAVNPRLAGVADGIKTAYRLVYAYLAGGAR